MVMARAAAARLRSVFAAAGPQPEHVRRILQFADQDKNSFQSLPLGKVALPLLL